jgi:hypothetical protein
LTVRCAATYRKIIAADDYETSVDSAGPHHEVRGTELDDFVALILHRARERAVFVKASRIEQMRNALAHGQLAAIVLTFDVVGAAHLLCELDAAFDFVEFRLPGHNFLASRQSYGIVRKGCKIF